MSIKRTDRIDNQADDNHGLLIGPPARYTSEICGEQAKARYVSDSCPLSMCVCDC